MEQERFFLDFSRGGCWLLTHGRCVPLRSGNFGTGTVVTTLLRFG